MVRVISMSSVPTSDGSSQRARAGAWQSGADGHAMRAVPVDEEDRETVLARRKQASKAEAACVRKARRLATVVPVAAPRAVNLLNQ